MTAGVPGSREVVRWSPVRLPQTEKVSLTAKLSTGELLDTQGIWNGSTTQSLAARLSRSVRRVPPSLDFSECRVRSKAVLLQVARGHAGKSFWLLALNLLPVPVGTRRKDFGSFMCVGYGEAGRRLALPVQGRPTVTPENRPEIGQEGILVSRHPLRYHLIGLLLLGGEKAASLSSYYCRDGEALLPSGRFDRRKSYEGLAEAGTRCLELTSLASVSLLMCLVAAKKETRNVLPRKPHNEAKGTVGSQLFLEPPGCAAVTLLFRQSLHSASGPELGSAGETEGWERLPRGLSMASSRGVSRCQAPHRSARRTVQGLQHPGCCLIRIWR